jgi:hypothetical protein
MRAEDQMLIELWSQDVIAMPTHEIAKRLRCGISMVHKKREQLGLPPRRRVSKLRGAMKVQVDEAEFRRLWAMPVLKMPTKQIAAHFKISPSTVSSLRCRWRLPRREMAYLPRLSAKVNVDIPTLYRLWNESAETMPVAEICRQLGGISQSHLYSLAKRHKLPGREKFYANHEDDPTPEEIAERAAEVRRGWAEGVAEQRLVGYVPDSGWTPPAFSFNGRHAAFEGTAVDF